MASPNTNNTYYPHLLRQRTGPTALLNTYKLRRITAQIAEKIGPNMGFKTSLKKTGIARETTAIHIIIATTTQMIEWKAK